MSKFDYLSTGEIPPEGPNLRGRWVLVLPKSYKRRRGDYVETIRFKGVKITSPVDGRIIGISQYDRHSALYLRAEPKVDILSTLTHIKITNSSDQRVTNIKGSVLETGPRGSLYDYALLGDDPK